MLSSIFVLLSMFGSPAVPVDGNALDISSDRAVADVSDADTTDKNICDDIGPNYVKCQYAPSCRWDAEDARCEPIVGGHCNFQFPGACSAHPDCVWDSYEGRCEHI
jgi:hypothetical protein